MYSLLVPMLAIMAELPATEHRSSLHPHTDLFTTPDTILKNNCERKRMPARSRENHLAGALL
jgi:hypothetical protein